MKKSNKKLIALLLAASMLLTGASQVSARSTKGTDDVTVLENTADTTTGSAATGSAASDSAVSPEPDDTLEPTEPDVTDPGDTTPDTSDTSVIYAKGATFSSGKYTYKVTIAPTSTTNGAVKVIGLTNTGITTKTVTVPDSVTKSGYTYLVTAIGSRAFTASTALTKITLKSNITFIGARAFQKVSTLNTVVLGSNITIIKKRAFSGCSGLRIVTLPTKVKTIGKKAFNNCKSLNSVVIQSKVVTAIKTGAFNNVKTGFYVVLPSGKKASYKAMLKTAGISSPTLYTF